MTAAPVPTWLRPLLVAGGAARTKSARAVLEAERPWDETRKGLASAVLAEPAAARAALSALRGVADRGRDRSLSARLRLLEARAIHRSGALPAALSAYADAERRLRSASLSGEALTVSVARVDALATSGRVAEALALAASVRRRIGHAAPSMLSASLDVNRGNALRLAGRLEEAVAAYAAAAESLETLGSAYGAGVARLNEGVALVEAGDVDAAHRLFARQAREFAAAGLSDLALEARTNLAHADAQAGRLGEAIRALTALAEEHHAASLPRREALVRLDLALALDRAGDRAAAEREAQRAAEGFRSAGARAERAEALFLAAAAAAPDAPRRAAAHLSAARAAASSAGRPGLVLRCEVLAADLDARRGRPPTLAALLRVERRALALGQTAVATDAALSAGAIALEAKDRPAARRAFERARRAGALRPWSAIAAETGLAAVEAATPAGRARALARLVRVARFLDAVRTGLPGAWLRASFAAERLDPYLARVDLLLERDRPADRRAAAAILDALAARRFRSARPHPTASARLARARRRLEALYDRLARGEGGTRGIEPGFAAEGTLERRARAWERAVAEEWRREERSAPPAPSDAIARPVLANVPDGAVVLHLWRRGDRVLALVRRADAVSRRIDLGPAEDLEGLAESLRMRARRWAFLRAQDPATGDASDVERVLADLASRLLPPLGVATWPETVLVQSAPGLPDLPWELLPTEGGRLGASRRVIRIPAAGIAPRDVPRGEGTVVVGVGEPDLPGAAREVESLAAATGAVRVLAGPAATRAAMANALSTARVVHVAGHGWDAEEAPPLGGVRVADGWFGAGDLPAEGVGCDLVVLAACRTGRAAGKASLAWGGLVDSLLAAGARRVVWTLDDVDDAAAASLTTLFHATRRDMEDARAFGTALAGIAARLGHPAAVLPFRLSGVTS